MIFEHCTGFRILEASGARDDTVVHGDFQFQLLRDSLVALEGVEHDRSSIVPVELRLGGDDHIGPRRGVAASIPGEDEQPIIAGAGKELIEVAADGFAWYCLSYTALARSRCPLTAARYLRRRR